MLLIITLCLSLVLDNYYTSTPHLIELDANDEESVWNDIYQSKINVDIAIYGSSRAWVHVDPVIIDSILGVSSYNLGMDGHSFYMQYYRHKEYFKFNDEPKSIVVLVDWLSFDLVKEGLYNPNQFRPYLLWNTNAIDHMYGNQDVDPLDFFIPFYRYRGRINPYRKFLEEKQPIVNRKRGFKSFEKGWTGLDSIEPFYKKFDNKVLTMFEEFLFDMKSRDIKVILVVAPFYIEGQAFVINKDENMGIIQNIATNMSVPLLDYSQSYISYNKNFFYNNAHMNATGAQLFSKQLAEDLKVFY